MQKIEILVVGKHPEIMNTILRLVNNKVEYNGTIAFSCEEAMEQAGEKNFECVLIAAGLSNSESDQLRAYFKVPVIQHYGGGSGLIYAEIIQALGS